ncbi:MAG: alpha/beta hydrolase [Myxococcales bacterium]|nr:alpha/beta hydrolase [Myxococcales bacterium]
MTWLHSLEKAARWSLHRSGVQSRYIETEHGTIHAYESEGQGDLPTIVLLHGISSSATSFGRLFGPLRKSHRRVIALDALGHGFSQVPKSPLHPELIFGGLHEALQVLCEEKFVLFGNSMGGAMALRFALDHSERLRALILSSPAGAYMDVEEFRDFLTQFSMEKRATAKAFVQKLYHRVPWYGSFLVPALRQQFLRPQILQFFHAAAPDQLFSPEELASLKPTTLFLWGESERLMRPEHLAYFEEHLPSNAIIERPEKVGHCPHIERPEDLAKRIVAFVREVENPA